MSIQLGVGRGEGVSMAAEAGRESQADYLLSTEPYARL